MSETLLHPVVVPVNRVRLLHADRRRQFDPLVPIGQDSLEDQSRQSSLMFLSGCSVRSSQKQRTDLIAH